MIIKDIDKIAIEIKKIEQDDINEVIEYAKTKNILGKPVNRFEELIQIKVKHRLAVEGLNYDVISPE